MHRFQQSWRTILISALLGVLTLAVFWPVRGYDFIRLDDGQYVFLNPHVTGGLTWENVGWAFRTGYASNWHPVTWLSHMLDVHLFGLKAGWHHLMNLWFHTANTILLFLILKRITGRPWRSAMAAALFALHPLHVESVAWVAERKDVLSTFFFLLTIGAYAAYAKRAGKPGYRAGGWYGLAFLMFALGLMSKPMLVTTPLVLLLLDFWPLQRALLPAATEGADDSAGRISRTPATRLLWEKIPFACLAMASCVVTCLAQEKGHAMMLPLPLARRVANALTSYLIYLGKTIWPADLAIYYPHPDTRYPLSNQWPGWEIVAAAFLLALISVWVLMRRRRRPWLAMGWFWYLVTLVPVIGLIQVGGQAMADRYSYIPLIGIFVALVWQAAEVLDGRRLGRAALASAAVVVVAVCAVLTRNQLNYWRSNKALFGHSLAVTGNNPVALFQEGIEFSDQERFGQAMAFFRAAIRADPAYYPAYRSLGVLLEGLGRRDEAVATYEAALRVMPWLDGFHNHLGVLLWAMGRREEALAHYREALRSNPDFPEAHFNLGTALAAEGDFAGAATQLAEAVRLKRDYAEAQSALSDVRAKLGPAGR